MWDAIAVFSDGHECHAFSWNVLCHVARYVCPGCREEVFPRGGGGSAGSPRRHFAHGPTSTCSRGVGESELHVEAKYLISHGLTVSGHCASVEAKCASGNRADVLFDYEQDDGTDARSSERIAVEFQHSAIAPSAITERSELYHRDGHPVLWCVPFQPRMAFGILQPWEWHLSAMYFGMLWLWVGSPVGGEMVQAMITPRHVNRAVPLFSRQIAIQELLVAPRTRFCVPTGVLPQCRLWTMDRESLDFKPADNLARPFKPQMTPSMRWGTVQATRRMEVGPAASRQTDVPMLK